MLPKALGFCIPLIVAFGLSGCATDSNRKIDDAAVPDRPPPASPIAPILEMMSILPQGDPAQQAEIFQAAKDAAEANPTTSNKLRYALALATPGHSGTDPVAAERQLSELLARPETLLPVERLLAVVDALPELDRRCLVLRAEGLRYREIAGILDMSLGAVSISLARSLARIARSAGR